MTQVGLVWHTQQMGQTQPTTQHDSHRCDGAISASVELSLNYFNFFITGRLLLQSIKVSCELGDLFNFCVVS